MASLNDYAAFSARVYWDSRRGLNINPLPSTWTEIAYSSDMANNPFGSGFTGGAYRNNVTGEIVIAFKGTDFLIGTNTGQTVSDLVSDIALGSGLGSSQLSAAALFYQQIKNNPLYSGADITFTGHSLGGGLASVMSVWFNRQATVFDEAPFEISAINPVLVSLVSAYLGLKGFTDAQFLSFLNPLAYSARQAQVTNYYVDGEVLELLRAAWPTVVGSDNQIDVGGASSLSSVTLHSINLLAALKMQDKLRTDTLALPNLLPAIFDTKLYATDLGTDQRDFLTHLLNDQIRVGYGNADGLLTRFSLDAEKLAQGGTVSNDALNKALITAVIEDYYFMEDGFTHDFFQGFDGALSFDLKDIGPDWNDPDKQALKQLVAATQEIVGHQGGLFLPALQPGKWYVQAGLGVINATDGSTDNVAMIGGALNDQLASGSGNDFLFGGDNNDTLTGNAGNDVLVGGHGNDTLDGGSGNDTYISGLGNDTIADSDGKGKLFTETGQLLAGAIVQQDGDYVLLGHPDVGVNSGSGLTLSLQNGAHIVLSNFDDFATGELYLRRSDDPQAPSTSRSIVGDIEPADLDPMADGVQIGHDDLGNIIGTPEGKPGNADTLNGSAGNDLIQGLGGNDSLFANGGDDHVEGGEGKDRVTGGAGSDLIVGGAGLDILFGDDGNDTLYAEEQVALVDSYSEGETQAAQAGQELLDGGLGDDVLVGGASHDALLGGGGDDFLLGGGGDDLLLGDRHLTSVESNWSVTHVDSSYYVFSNAVLEEPYDASGYGADLLYGGAGRDSLIGFGGNDLLVGGAGDDGLFGWEEDDILLGGAGNDELLGDAYGIDAAREGDDWLDGGDGNDTLTANGGNDVLIGGKGNDILNGGAGKDTYIFNLGDGIETIEDADTGEDKSVLIFGEGIDPETIKLRQGSLLIDLGNGDQVHIADFDPDQALESATFESFQFADGTSLSWDELLARGFDLDGSDSSDTIFGTSTADRINGMGGTDGFDGGLGDDIYYFQAGDSPTLLVEDIEQAEHLIDTGGNDTIRFAANVSVDNLRFIANGDGGLVIDYNATNAPLDRLLIDQGQSGSIEHFNFMQADTTQITLDYEQLIGRHALGVFGATGSDGVLHTTGGAGNETISLGADNAIVSGGRGDDTISLAGQNTTVRFYRGDGHDLLTTGGQGSSVYFADQTVGEISLQRSGDNLLMSNVEGDTVTVTGWLQNDGQGAGLQTLQFVDGTVWHGDDIRAALLAPTPADDHLVGYAGADAIHGAEGNDVLEGMAGDDLLNGDSGNDVLIGGAGADVLAGGVGEDVYRLAPGSGADTVIDGGTEMNVIRLESWQSVDDLRTVREGNDLKLIVTGVADSLTINDYYAAGEQHWAVDFGGANAVTLEALAARPDPVDSAISTLWNFTKNDTLTRSVQDGQIRGWAYLGNLNFDQQPLQLTNTISHQLTTTTFRTLMGGFISSFQETIDSSTITRWGFGSTDPIRSLYRLTTSRIESDDALIVNVSNDSTQSAHANLIATISLGGQQNNYQHLTWSDSGFFNDTNGNTLLVIHDYDLTSYSRNGSVVSYSGNIAGWSAPKNTLVGNRVLVSLTTSTSIRDIVSEIVGGDSDNEIHAESNARELVDGGAGNDTIYGGKFISIGGYASGYGDLLYGNSGDDVIHGDGSTIVGGDGSDKLYGGIGSDRYVVLSPDETGIDLIEDSGNTDEIFKRWYYESRGIDNWHESGDSGHWELWPGEGMTFDSREELDAYFVEFQPDWSVDEALASGDLVYFPPVESPLIGNGKDYRLLNAVANASIANGWRIEQDFVELPEGVTRDNLSFAWGSQTSSDGELRATLDIGWTGVTKLRIALPNANDPIGWGVEYVTLADGSYLWMQDMLDLAPLMPNLGDGTQVGNGGDNIIVAGSTGEHLFGMSGDDTLEGGAGADTFYGGDGNDISEGGTGNDVYVFRRGEGQDVVLDHDATAGNVDTIFFVSETPGYFQHVIAPEDVSVTREGTSLVLSLNGTHNGTQDRLTLLRWFEDAAHRVERVEFSDGMRWDTGALLARVQNGPDVLDDSINLFDGSPGADVIEGRGGDDELRGMQGNDFIKGGAGNDVVSGGGGSDVYFFERGDGVDSIYQDDSGPVDVDVVRFGDGILASEVTVSLGSNSVDILLSLGDSGDELALQNWLDPVSARVSAVEFADGTVWDTQTLQSKLPVLPIVGTEGDDFLDGTAANDTIEGLAGNDILNSREGDDSLHGGAGDDLLDAETGDDLLYGGDGDDSLYGYLGNDLLSGGTGSDSLYGGEGDDVYVFDLGDGLDMVYQNDSGATDIDVIRFGAGIAASDVTATIVDTSDLLLSVGTGGDGLMVRDWVYSGDARLSRVEFADGTVWDAIPIANNQGPATDIVSEIIGLGVVIDLSQLLDVSDPEGDLPTRYQFRDVAAGGGYLMLDGVAQPAQSTLTLTPSQLDGLQYVGADVQSTSTLRVRAYDGAAWGAWATWTMTNSDHAINEAPVITASQGIVGLNGMVSAEALFGVTDADGDAVQRYQFRDAGAAGGHFLLDGVQQPAATTLTLEADHLATLQYAGNVIQSSENILARAWDGLSWSEWTSWKITSTDHATNVAPMISVNAAVVSLDTAVSASSLFSVSDQDGDTAQQYQFFDTSDAGGSIVFDGVTQTAGSVIAITADQLAALQYVGGSTQGAENIRVRAWDGLAWGDWTTWSMASSNHATNGAPVIVASDGIVGVNATVGASSLFGLSDIDGDAPQRYQFFDVGDGGGNFTLDGVSQVAGSPITLDAGQLSSLQYVGGAGQGHEKIRARAWDGLAWSAWTAWDIATSDHATNIAPVAMAANQAILAGQQTLAGNLFSVTDADGDAPVQYQLWDTVNGGGYFSVNGVVQEAGAAITVAASDLSDVSYGGGAGNVVETVRVRANDGLAWGAWKSWKMTTTGFQLGGIGNDTLTGTGSDILQGGNGSDTLTTPSGNGLLSGGGGNDTLNAGTGSNISIGGGGNDIINAGAGQGVISHNVGDGHDTVYSAGGPSTLSLGGGTSYQDLALSKNGNDLVLNTGDDESITFKDWYADASKQSVLNMQVIADTLAGFDQQGSDSLLDDQVEVFDFKALVNRFNQARAADANITSWNAMDALLDAHLFGTDGGAIGGDLAYQYGHYGTLANVGLVGARNVLAGSQFSVGVQAFQSLQGLQEGVVKLG